VVPFAPEYGNFQIPSFSAAAYEAFQSLCAQQFDGIEWQWYRAFSRDGFNPVPKCLRAERIEEFMTVPGHGWESTSNIKSQARHTLAFDKATIQK
jgi:hypothetical protein